MIEAVAKKLAQIYGAKQGWDDMSDLTKRIWMCDAEQVIQAYQEEMHRQPAYNRLLVSAESDRSA